MTLPDASTAPVNSAFGPIVAVIVTYYIGKSIEDTINSIKNQVDGIVIVDNGSDEKTLSLLREIANVTPRMNLIERRENNLAAAQNIGITHARKLGAAWVLLVDHDSVFDSKAISEMAKTYSSLSAMGATHNPLPPAGDGRVRESASGRKGIALLAPAFYDQNSERPPRYLRTWGRFLFRRTGFGDKPYLDDVMCAIASGSLIKMSVLDKVGGMDEHYGIDDVDREFCLRLVTNGYSIIAMRDAILHHQIGQCRDHKLMGVCVTTSNHSPDRRYTIYRNRMRNWKRYGLKLPGFVLSDILAMLLDLTRIFACEDQKKTKLRAAFRGLKDGFF